MLAIGNAPPLSLSYGIFLQRCRKRHAAKCWNRPEMPYGPNWLDTLPH
jgi:hypothetical protein